MKSIIHDKRERTCYLCMALHGDYSTQTALEEHHVVYGRGRRKLSTKYGLLVYLCHAHHRDSAESIHNNTKHTRKYDMQLKEIAQKCFEEKYPKLNWIEIFGKNYIEISRKEEKRDIPAAQHIAEMGYPPGFIPL